MRDDHRPPDDWDPRLSASVYGPPHREGRSTSGEIGVWRKLSRVVEVVIYILLVLAIARLLGPDLDKRKGLADEVQQLEQAKAEQLKVVKALQAEHGSLASDQYYLETVARDRLNMQKPDEYVVQIERSEDGE